MLGKSIGIRNYRLRFLFLKYAWCGKTDISKSVQHGRGRLAEGSAWSTAFFKFL